MNVKINIRGVLQQYVGNRTSINVNGQTAVECIEDMIRQFPEARKWLLDKKGDLRVNLRVSVTKDGQTFTPKDPSSSVLDGEEIYLNLVVSGG